MLVDTGYPDGDRDAKRILRQPERPVCERSITSSSAISMAIIPRLGGAPKMIPIEKIFYDHGEWSMRSIRDGSTNTRPSPATSANIVKSATSSTWGRTRHGRDLEQQ